MCAIRVCIAEKPKIVLKTAHYSKREFCEIAEIMPKSGKMREIMPKKMGCWLRNEWNLIENVGNMMKSGFNLSILITNW